MKKTYFVFYYCVCICVYKYLICTLLHLVIYTNMYALSMGLRKHHLHSLQTSKVPLFLSEKGCPEYGSKLSLLVRLPF